jgi:glycosyltransferase involved in cell wall biosynthesis
MTNSRSSSPLVSIMIPTYNQERFLADAVESALAQNYPNIEVVVADDCSTDNTQALARRWQSESRFRYFRNATNLGRVGNYRNTLYRLIGGRWALNLDGDDYLCDPSFIARAVAALQAREDLVLAFAAIYDVIDGVPVAGLVQHHAPLLEGSEVVLNYAAIYRKRRPVVFIPHQTAVYDVAAARATDFYRYDILSADLESLLRLIVGRKIAFIEGTVACWRHHGANATARPDAETLWRNFGVVDGVYAHLERYGVWSAQVRQRWRTDMAQAKFVNDAESLIASGQAGALPKFYRRACQRYPAVAACAFSPAIARAFAAATAKRILRYRRPSLAKMKPLNVGCGETPAGERR